MAKFLVVSEIAEVTSETEETITGKVEKALERCITNRARRLVKTKTAKLI